MMKGRLAVLVAVMHFENLIEIILFVLTSDMFHLAGGGHMTRVLLISRFTLENFNDFCHFRVCSRKKRFAVLYTNL